MKEQFNINKITEYKEKLEPYFIKVRDEKPLSSQEVAASTKIVNEYYNYLANSGIAYGGLARDVVNNHGSFAGLANNHLEHRALQEGKSIEQIANIKNNIRVALAYNDANLRSDNKESINGLIGYNKIANYHYDAFEKQGLSKYAWGGTFFEEFAGSGSWMDLGGYDKSIDVKQIDLFKAVLNNQYSNGVSAHECIKTLYNIPIDHFGDSIAASVYRTVISSERVYNLLQKTHNGYYAPDGHLYDYKEYKTQVLDKMFMKPAGNDHNNLGNTNLEHLMAAVGLDWNILFEAQDRQTVANMQNLEMLRNGPNSWWKDKEGGSKGPSFNFQNPFDGGPKGGGNPPPTGPSGGGGWTPPSGYGGGWGSFWQAASDYMKFSTAKPLSPFMQTMMDYKPAYNQLYETKPSFLSEPSKFQAPTVGSYISEPSFLYGNNEYNNELSQARSSFKNQLKSCLGNSYCTDDLRTIMNRAVSGVSDMLARYAITSELRREAGWGGGNYEENPGWLVRAGMEHQKYALGKWTHQLRKDLGYAASHVSPLVFDLAGDGIKLYPYTQGVYFDIDNDGFAEKIGWASTEDGQLGRDLNRNGKIDDITELFGDDLISAYYKLSLLDSNNDKVIDQKDEKFNELLMWQDKNLNGRSEPEELNTLKQFGIKSISLETKPDDRIIEGNTITETSSFTYEDGRTFEVADVHYHNDDMDSWYKGKAIKASEREDKFGDEIEKFRTEVAKALNEEAHKREGKASSEDWIAITLKVKVEEFVTNYKKRYDKVMDELGIDINQGYRNKLVNHRQEQEGKIKSVLKAQNVKYAAEFDKMEEEIIAEINNKIKAEQEAISSKYQQSYNAEYEQLLANINAQLQVANQASGNHLMNHFQAQTHQYNQGIMQQQYNEAINRARDDNYARFEKELEIKTAELKNKYVDLIQLEQDQVGKKYGAEHKIKVMALRENLQQSHSREADELL